MFENEARGRPKNRELVCSLIFPLDVHFLNKCRRFLSVEKFIEILVISFFSSSSGGSKKIDGIYWNDIFWEVTMEIKTIYQTTTNDLKYYLQVVSRPSTRFTLAPSFVVFIPQRI